MPERLSKEECMEFAFLCRNKGRTEGRPREVRGVAGIFLQLIHADGNINTNVNIIIINKY